MQSVSPKQKPSNKSPPPHCDIYKNADFWVILGRVPEICILTIFSPTPLPPADARGPARPGPRRCAGAGMSERLSPSGGPFWGAWCQGGRSPRPRAGLQPALPCADHHLRRCPACPAASPVSWLHLGEVVTPTLPSPDVTDLSGDGCAEPPAESPEPLRPRGSRWLLGALTGGQFRRIRPWCPGLGTDP